jgi:carbon storage regulator
MLVVRRRPGESLMIGDDVEIEFLESTHSYVKIGIHAPKEVLVLRKELYLTGQQNRAASRKISEELVGPLLSLRSPRR